MDNLKLYVRPIMDMYNGEILSNGISMHPPHDLVESWESLFKLSTARNTGLPSTQIKAGITSTEKGLRP